MRRALTHIAERQTAFAALPFFEYLRDRSVPPSTRFLFAPAVAPFVMAFADLNRFALYAPNPSAPLEELISRHSEEDATHYQMYLQDIQALGFDTALSFSDALRFLWADQRTCSRQTCYALTTLLAKAPLRLRLVILEAMESAGAAAFETLGELAAQYCSATGRALEFFGRRHQELETGHTIGSENIEERLHEIVLTNDEVQQALPLIDQVFEIFAAMMNELHRYGRARAAEETAGEQTTWLTV